jgi:hypothetical protein
LIEVSEGPDLSCVKTRGDLGSHEPGLDVQFLARLLQWDLSIAQEIRAGGCPWCGGRLDRADYERKPRFGLVAPEPQAPGWSTRLSLCCSREGCRRRVTPPSVRFLGRRVYAEVVVLVACARALMRAEVDGKRVDSGVPRRTVKRWLGWWRTAFLASALWQELRSRLLPPIDESRLPASLMERATPPSSLLGVARWLSPLTSGSAPNGSWFSGAAM